MKTFWVYISTFLEGQEKEEKCHKCATEEVEWKKKVTTKKSPEQMIWLVCPTI